MKKSIFFLSATMLLASCGTTTAEFESEKSSFTPNEAFELVNSSALLIDVRDYEEVAIQSYDVKNSLNIPLDSIENKLSEIPKDKQVILACRSGKRSQKAYDILVANGFKNVATLDGGIIAWEDAGLAVIKNEPAEKSACCSDPTSPNCNPDGTCKVPEEKSACCADPSSANCNPDGTCKTPEEK